MRLNTRSERDLFLKFLEKRRKSCRGLDFLRYSLYGKISFIDENELEFLNDRKRNKKTGRSRDPATRTLAFYSDECFKRKNK